MAQRKKIELCEMRHGAGDARESDFSACEKDYAESPLCCAGWPYCGGASSAQY